MVTKSLAFINKYSSLFFIAAILTAIALPSMASIFHPYLSYLLIGVLFFGFIKLDFTILKSEILNWSYQLYLVVLVALIIPAINYFIAELIVHLTNLPQDFAVGILLVFVTPTAAATPTLCILLNGRLERAMLNVVITSLLAPITIPLIFYLLLGHAVELNIAKLASFIGTIIVTPFILAMLIRKFFPPIRIKLLPIIQPASILLLFFLMLGASSILRKLIVENPTLGVAAFGLALVIFIMTFACGWLAALKPSTSDKITVAMMAAWTNLGLAIVIANQFFTTSYPKLMLFILTASIIWNLAIIIAKPVAATINPIKKGR